MVGGIPYMTTKRTNKTAPKSTNGTSQRPKSSRNGSYSAPTATTKVMRTAVPSVAGSPFSGDGKIVVKHREYIGEIAGSVAFSATSYSINPGLSSTFPWLSTLAANYESYKFRDLKFEFETEKSTSTNGSLMMAVDFDAADSAPASKTTLMSYQNAVRSAPWCPCEYRSSGDDLRKFGVQRYLRSAALASNLDIKTYDVGNLIVATSGNADTTTLGELYVSYEVELHTPQLSASASQVGGQFLVGVSGTTGTSWFGTTPTSTGVAYFTATGSTMTCAIAGTYCLTANPACSSGYTSGNLGGTATVANFGASDMSGYAASNGEVYCKKITATVGQTVTFTGLTGTTWSKFFCVIVPCTGI